MSRVECDRDIVWRVWRRYEEGGLKKLIVPVNPSVESGSLPPVRVPERLGSERMILELTPTMHEIVRQPEW